MSEFDAIVDGRVELARVRYQKRRIEKELPRNSSSPNRISQTTLNSLRRLLCGDPKELDMHRFIEDYPELLNQVLRGGHGRYQISKKRLGSEFVTDFMIADVSSIGIEWHAVELESPSARVFRKDERPTAEVHHAVSQIHDWRNWLMNNIDYARRSKEDNGLGLIGIDHRIDGLIIMGRRHNFPKHFNEFRRTMIDRERITIHSYDWLVDLAERHAIA